MVRLLFPILVVLLLVTTFLFKAGAQQYTGCYRSATGRIYYQQNGTSGGYPNYNSTPYENFNSVYCKVSLGTTCRVNKKSNQTGVVYTFYMVQCPLDDYAGLLLVICSGFGFYKLKKRKADSVDLLSV